MNVIWSATAVRQLHQVVEQFQAENVSAASAVQRRILETIDWLSQMPYSGRIGRVSGTREAVVPRTPFIVAYRVSEEGLEVLTIWHGARLWPTSF